ncbi:hypothetical protein NHX12_005695 [Muraenolepis orangiensis]|uniref:Uncharacterized protein n=1 Tax=Muraenolepis orangiensis TaxID=630683 RepID=A0A9Q0DUE2_9TELE|nr:hypothetical protein NHX12_005695 [Muraenolepis orangiensis]
MSFMVVWSTTGGLGRRNAKGLRQSAVITQPIERASGRLEEYRVGGGGRGLPWQHLQASKVTALIMRTCTAERRERRGHLTEG